MIKVCRPWITRNGVRIFAKDVGKKAFCWYVTEEKHKEYLEKKAKEKTTSKTKGQSKQAKVKKKK